MRRYVDTLGEAISGLTSLSFSQKLSRFLSIHISSPISMIFTTKIFFTWNISHSQSQSLTHKTHDIKRKILGGLGLGAFLLILGVFCAFIGCFATGMDSIRAGGLAWKTSPKFTHDETSNKRQSEKKTHITQSCSTRENMLISKLKLIFLASRD